LEASSNIQASMTQTEKYKSVMAVCFAIV
jgi:hypothetical protein